MRKLHCLTCGHYFELEDTALLICPNCNNQPEQLIEAAGNIRYWLKFKRVFYNTVIRARKRFGIKGLRYKKYTTHGKTAGKCERCGMLSTNGSFYGKAYVCQRCISKLLTRQENVAGVHHRGRRPYIHPRRERVARTINNRAKIKDIREKYKL